MTEPPAPAGPHPAAEKDRDETAPVGYSLLRGVGWSLVWAEVFALVVLGGFELASSVTEGYGFGEEFWPALLFATLCVAPVVGTVLGVLFALVIGFFAAASPERGARRGAAVVRVLALLPAGLLLQFGLDRAAVAIAAFFYALVWLESGRHARKVAARGAASRTRPDRRVPTV